MGLGFRFGFRLALRGYILLALKRHLLSVCVAYV